MQGQYLFFIASHCKYIYTILSFMKSWTAAVVVIITIIVVVKVAIRVHIPYVVVIVGGPKREQNYKRTTKRPHF